MTSKIKNYILLTVIVFGQYSCDIMDSQALHVFNDTNDTLFCFWDTNDNSYSTGNNPLNGYLIITKQDTSWNKEWNCLLFPKTQSRFTDYNWKHTISDSKTKKLYVNFYLVRSFYHKDRVMNEKVKPDTVLSYAFDELQKINWQVHLADKSQGH